MKIVNIPIRPNCSGNNSRARIIPTINCTLRAATVSRKLHERALIVLFLRLSFTCFGGLMRSAGVHDHQASPDILLKNT
jgi:hypothetical protein